MAIISVERRNLVRRILGGSGGSERVLVYCLGSCDCDCDIVVVVVVALGFWYER